MNVNVPELEWILRDDVSPLERIATKDLEAWAQENSVDLSSESDYGAAIRCYWNDQLEKQGGSTAVGPLDIIM